MSSLAFLLLFITCCEYFDIAKVYGANEFSVPEPNIIEINLAGTNTLKQVEVFSEGKISYTKVNRMAVDESILPGKRFCGMQHTDDRIYTDQSTAIDEFPWLVDIVHQDDISICPGVLINKNFVLTGYGCAIFSYKVRLGLYHTNNPVTCIDNSDISECSDPPLEVKVDTAMFTNVKGEIALLKLVEKIDYTEFIRPICLPFDPSTRPVHRDTLVASGWGKNVEDAAGNSKKRLLFKLKDPKECGAIDSLIVNNDEFCFISEETRSDIGCIDDYGGPIMYTDKHQWYVEGILIGPYARNRAYGYCSEGQKPIYGKKITNEILDWILDTITL